MSRILVASHNRKEYWFESYLNYHNICQKRKEHCYRLFHQPPRHPAKPLRFEAYKPRHDSSLPPIFYQNGGRLGNLMLEYATMQQVSRFYGRELVIGDKMADILNSTFLLKSTRHRIQRYIPSKLIPFTKGLPVELTVIFNHSDTYSKTYRHYGHHRLYEHEAEEIQNLFTFHEDIMVKAKREISALRVNKRTLVGIHIRRGDIARICSLATVDYFRNAMGYFQMKYNNVHFVVATLHVKWVMDELAQENMSILRHNSAPVHLAALTLCDHNILSVGTFSYWSGWLGRGEVIFYDGENHSSSDKPAHWIADAKIETSANFSYKSNDIISNHHYC